jgi:hypothetical protein
MLSRDEILGADDLQREEVQVPEWRGLRPRHDWE